MPGCAIIKIGDETFTSTHKLTSNARHFVMLKTLNKTSYRYTNLPGALRSFMTVHGAWSAQLVMPSDSSMETGAKDTATAKAKPNTEKSMFWENDHGNRNKQDSFPEPKLSVNKQYKWFPDNTFWKSSEDLVNTLAAQNKVISL